MSPKCWGGFSRNTCQAIERAPARHPTPPTYPQTLASPRVAALACLPAVAGARVYVTMFPCNECAKLMIQVWDWQGRPRCRRGQRAGSAPPSALLFRGRPCPHPQPTPTPTLPRKLRHELAYLCVACCLERPGSLGAGRRCPSAPAHSLLQPVSPLTPTRCPAPPSCLPVLPTLLPTLLPTILTILLLAILPHALPHAPAHAPPHPGRDYRDCVPRSQGPAAPLRQPAHHGLLQVSAAGLHGPLRRRQHGSRSCLHRLLRAGCRLALSARLAASGACL